MNAKNNRWLVCTAMAAALGVAGSAHAVEVDFTGGTVTQNNGATGVTNNSAEFQNVLRFEDQGFQMEFTFSGPPSAFATIVGDYYGTANDVIHFHWSDGPFGEVDELRISKIDGSTFDLGGFRVSTNTSVGGGFSTGGEKVWINTSKANEIFTLTPDNWGLGSGTDPLISIAASNTLFDDVSWFSFTNDSLSTAVGLGLDNFFLDEAGDPNGTDPTNTQVPVPATLALMGLGLAGLGYSKKRKK